MRKFDHSIEPPHFRVGDVVEVLTKEEILSTLDENGALENLPFMPEMLRFCGQQFEVFKRADKTCNAGQAEIRRLQNTVHLKELRCDGSAHGGCEAGCLIFWKEQWLKKDGSPQRGISRRGDLPQVCTEQALLLATRHNGNAGSIVDAEPCYSCQATRIAHFTSPLPWWDIRQYFRDLTSGNVTFSGFVRGLFMGLCNKFLSLSGGRGLKKLSGTRARTPADSLSLAPGDLVRIKGTDEIRETLDPRGKNRGLTFTRDMMAFCDREYRVARRINKIIDERTGKMISLAGGCLVLDGVVCTGHLRFCPRSAYQFWRDIWLSKIGAAETVASEAQGACLEAASGRIGMARRVVGQFDENCTAEGGCATQTQMNQ